MLGGIFMRHFWAALLGLGMACAATAAYAYDTFGELGIEAGETGDSQKSDAELAALPSCVGLTAASRYARCRFELEEGFFLRGEVGGMFTTNAPEGAGGQEDWLAELSALIEYEGDIGDDLNLNTLEAHWYVAAGATLGDYWNDQKDDETESHVTLGLSFLFVGLDDGEATTYPTLDLNVQAIANQTDRFGEWEGSRYRFNAKYQYYTLRSVDDDHVDNADNNNDVYWQARLKGTYRYESQILPGLDNNIAYHHVGGQFRLIRGLGDGLKAEIDAGISYRHYDLEIGAESDSLRGDIGFNIVQEIFDDLEIEAGVNFTTQDSTADQFDYEAFRAPFQLKLNIPLQRRS